MGAEQSSGGGSKPRGGGDQGTSWSSATHSRYSFLLLFTNTDTNILSTNTVRKLKIKKNLKETLQ